MCLHELELAEFYILSFKLCFIQYSESLEKNIGVKVVNHSHNMSLIYLIKDLCLLSLVF